MLSDFGLYKWLACEKMVIGYEEDEIYDLYGSITATAHRTLQGRAVAQKFDTQGEYHMDPISIAPLVISTWKLIAPYAKKVGGKLIEKTGEALPDVVGKLWEIVKEKMEARPETSSLPTDLVHAPEDPAVQGAFQYQLKKLLENDEAFAKQLEKLVNEAKQVTIYSATLEGNGALAQGDGATAVGRGGVYIGGNASEGNIITGDNNSVDSEEKKKK